MDFPYGQIVNTTSSSGNLNVLAEINHDIDRFGLCAAPGTSFILNGQNLHVDRTGVFEIETTINSLLISQINPFIFDYHIKEEVV